MNQTNSPETQLLNPTLEEQKMLQQLRENPYLATQFQTIANQFEMEISNGMDAHQAEEALLISLQQLGKTMMIQWAENTQRKVLEDDPTLQKHSKKKLVWYSTFGVISLFQQVMRDKGKGKLQHPFRDFAKISNKSASRALQRRIVDFSAERSFQNTATALHEHYKIDIPIYTIDKATSIISKEAKHFNSKVPENIKPASTLISEVDGSMLPIVEFKEKGNESNHLQSDNYDDKKTDKRKLRCCVWKEIRISIARIPGCVEAHYGVALGDPFTVGCMMNDCCKFKGLNDLTYIHAVSDGAPWIANQYELQFGDRCKYFVDFYHVCEYLVTAAKSTKMELEERNLWLETQKKHLRDSEAQKVIKALRDLDPSELIDGNHPVSIAIAYLQNRIHQLDYKDAIERKLPIGSGEVESAHRHLLQKRLKISGAWWRLERAEEIAQLRAMRANNHWADFWQQKSA